MSTDLNPCPCCESTDVKFSHVEGDDPETNLHDFVMCNGCGLMAARVDTECDPCEVWNRRAQPVAAIPEATGELSDQDIESIMEGLNMAFSQDEADQMIRFARAILEAVPLAAIPEAGQSVPCHATPEMIAAAEEVDELYRRGTPQVWGQVWSAMLAAAPSIASMSVDAEKGGT